MKNFFSWKVKKNISHNFLRLINIKDNDEIWFQWVHSYSVFYKSPIQIINNQFIIERLIPQDACVVGVICGEKYKEHLKNNLILNTTYEITMEDSYADNYKLISIERKGYIEYENYNNKRYITNIFDLAQNKTEIANFLSKDAYYIGFLAGIELYKIKNNLKIHSSKHPNLRLVYSTSCKT